MIRFLGWVQFGAFALFRISLIKTFKVSLFHLHFPSSVFATLYQFHSLTNKTILKMACLLLLNHVEKVDF